MINQGEPKGVPARVHPRVRISRIFVYFWAILANWGVADRFRDYRLAIVPIDQLQFREVVLIS